MNSEQREKETNTSATGNWDGQDLQRTKGNKTVAPQYLLITSALKKAMKGLLLDVLSKWQAGKAFKRSLTKGFFHSCKRNRTSRCKL